MFPNNSKIYNTLMSDAMELNLLTSLKREISTEYKPELLIIEIEPSEDPQANIKP